MRSNTFKAAIGLTAVLLVTLVIVNRGRRTIESPARQLEEARKPPASQPRIVAESVGARSGTAVAISPSTRTALHRRQRDKHPPSDPAAPSEDPAHIAAAASAGESAYEPPPEDIPSLGRMALNDSDPRR